ncbi:MAG: hypothetical protein KJP20_07515 [Bacteroidia bacterium]|nr:hypothetical protein [Bacteroidia bacterium]NNK59229.1 hypothetical protein [Flavobacteriaceae bacterium]
MKYILIILIPILFISCKNKNTQTDFIVNCFHNNKVYPENADIVLNKTCEFKNHIFKSIGKSDFNGRYSYEYEIFRIKNNDTLKINNVDFFNNNSIELERLINKKLKTENESNSENTEISDCLKWIKFRYYKLNEFGITFTDKNQMEFNIDYGIGSACFNVSFSSVIMEFHEIEKYLK